MITFHKWSKISSIQTPFSPERHKNQTLYLPKKKFSHLLVTLFWHHFMFSFLIKYQRGRLPSRSVSAKRWTRGRRRRWEAGGSWRRPGCRRRGRCPETLWSLESTRYWWPLAPPQISCKGRQLSQKFTFNKRDKFSCCQLIFFCLLWWTFI